MWRDPDMFEGAAELKFPNDRNEDIGEEKRVYSKESK